MSQFISDMPTNPFLLPGLLAGLLASLACGLIGPYVISRRIVFLSGAIAHIAVGGVGGAIFLAHHFPGPFGWLAPLHGAVVAAVGAALLIGLLHDQMAERIDTLIGAFWAIGMAVGICLIKFTPGYQVALMSYLFGNIAFIDLQDVLLMLALDAVIVTVVLLYHKRLLAICLDPQQAQLQGVNVLRTGTLLLVLVALTVICLIQMVGLILVIALLSLPAATVSHHVARMAPLMICSTILCVLLTTVPRMAVYPTNISAESAIVLSAGLVYLLSVLITHFRRGIVSQA